MDASRSRTQTQGSQSQPEALSREAMLDRATRGSTWDLVIVGGGATGLGCAVDAAQRGYRTLLVERHDFAQATSSRSTKLIHGGLRYVALGQWRLVHEALAERRWLLRAAAAIVHPLSFVIPCYRKTDRWWYATGLAVYDMLAGRQEVPASLWLTARQVLERLPVLRADTLRGGFLFYDAQFDDARLAISLMRTAAHLGACLLNYVEAEPLIDPQGRVRGVALQDLESGQRWQVAARCVINATGIFADQFRKKIDSGIRPLLSHSQGSHLVLEKDFWPHPTALLIPKTRDRRVIFVIPWYGRLLVGTTDVPVREPEAEPRARSEEIGYLLEHLEPYLARSIEQHSIRAVFSGQRPLVGRGDVPTARLSRDHFLECWPEGMVTITGGKWTTYRRMAQAAVDIAARQSGLPAVPCRTHELPLVGGKPLGGDTRLVPWMGGADAATIAQWIGRDPWLAEKLDPRLDYRWGDVLWCIRFEMARTVEDVLARRTRAVFLEPEAAWAVAPTVARMLAAELNRPAPWQQEQLVRFAQSLQQYCPPSLSPTLPQFTTSTQNDVPDA